MNLKQLVVLLGILLLSFGSFVFGDDVEPIVPAPDSADSTQALSENFIDQYGFSAATFDEQTTYGSGVLRHGSVGIDMNVNSLEGSSIISRSDGFELTVAHASTFAHEGKTLDVNSGDKIFLLEGGVIRVERVGSSLVPVDVEVGSRAIIQGDIQMQQASTQFRSSDPRSQVEVAPGMMKIKQGVLDVTEFTFEDESIRGSAQSGRVSDNADTLDSSVPTHFTRVEDTAIALVPQETSLQTVVEGLVPSLTIRENAVVVTPFDAVSLAYVTGEGDIQLEVGGINLFYRVKEPDDAVLAKGTLTTDIVGSNGAVRVGVGDFGKTVVGVVDITKIFN
ncbi:hypothetical protein HYV86_05320 [Candidatus Woesearchaeota archaeon]|nr:hypothetical protein [Candidatus Woesearchaeota archaeon]